MAAVRALILDFDGLVIDTESPVYDAWAHVYARHGVELRRDQWQRGIGTLGGFDPIAALEAQLGAPPDPQVVHVERRRLRDALLARCGLLPGVESLVKAARRRGLGVAIASSSPRDWVEPHLRRLGLFGAIDHLATEDDVSRVKPDPELYLLSLTRLGVDAAEAVAFEDSPHGVSAAVAAGIYCIAVPGPMTRDLSFAAANRTVRSLADHSLEELLASGEAGGGR